jgi:hypothetical protein
MPSKLIHSLEHGPPKKIIVVKQKIFLRADPSMDARFSHGMFHRGGRPGLSIWSGGVGFFWGYLEFISTASAEYRGVSTLLPFCYWYNDTHSTCRSLPTIHFQRLIG